MKKIWKKVLIIIIFIIGIVVVGLVSTFTISRMKKGYEVFGNEHCEGHKYDIAYPTEREYYCLICGKEKETPTIPIPKICPTCSKITKRCPKCGELLD